MAQSSVLDYLLMFIFYWFSLFCVNATTYRELLQIGQSIGISDTVVSNGGSYELGFFTRSKDNSTKYYIGIWFKKVPNDKIVWVANRDHAFQTTSPELTINPADGNIVVVDGQITYHVTNFTDNNNNSTYMALFDSGNLRLQNNSNHAILWDSFGNPTDTILAGNDLMLGNSWSINSWASADDPSPGQFTLKYDAVFHRLTINSRPIHRAGLEWNKKGYYSLLDDSNSRLVLEVSGDLNYQYWSEENMRWDSVQSYSMCRNNITCGVFSLCDPQALDPCHCMKGFEPVDGSLRYDGRRYAGCVRKTELLCHNKSSNSNDQFLRFDKVELPPDETRLKMDSTEKCESTCVKNCSCIAYAYYFNNYCMLWYDNILSLKKISSDIDDNNHLAFYLRLAASEFVTTYSNTTTKGVGKHRSRSRNLLLIVIPISILIILLLMCLFFFWTKTQRKKGDDLLHFEVGMNMQVQKEDKDAKLKKKEVKLPLFSFVSVSAATNNFSDVNKLGEGGFGPVYKGKLLNGDEVAVKRLSRRSGQGWEELRNEATLIAELQHNNLVRLLGCCIERDEKMLIYEFMPNKSLDCFLFDATKRSNLDWRTRVQIIEGIAQGLLYLHQYSRFRIIHRDLKASNILLDINMNPKISDFGMARIFSANEVQANTNRIVGTYGYMSPEYAMEGLFSIKSDVFSFGVLLLEIVSGKKNTRFFPTNSLNLLGYAWDLWINNSGINLMDSTLNDTYSKHSVLRYINIGLLCVQQSSADRPTMSDVISMIGNDTVPLPYPKSPAFQNVRGVDNSRLSSVIDETFSLNVMTDSIMEPR
ncbi:hypothetical protein P8452_69724 [Trifolium repens]|nr:hypothetical protein P8452_69724 [Trifolium repens]